MRPLPCSDLLNHLFMYDKSNGRLFWKNPRSFSKKPGDEAGCEAQNGHQRYRVVNISKVLYLTHRIVWVMNYGQLGTEEIIDHINRDGLDNRLINLRIASKRLNSLNARIQSRNVSGVKGVNWDKSREKWIAQMVVDGQRVFSKRFDDLESAIAARQKAERSCL
jgi:hypothetical protein